MDIRPVSKAEKKKAELSIRNTVGDAATICEHIRGIFRIAEREWRSPAARGKILEECKIIFVFAKRMNAKLVEYNAGKGKEQP